MYPYQYQTHPIYVLQRSNTNFYPSPQNASPTIFSSPPNEGMPPSEISGPQRQKSLPGNLALRLFQQAVTQVSQPNSTALEISDSYFRTLAKFNKLKKSEKLTSELENFAEKEKHFLDTLFTFYFKEHLIPEKILSSLIRISSSDPYFRTPSGWVLLGINICCHLQQAKVPPPDIELVWNKILQKAKAISRTTSISSGLISSIFNCPLLEKGVNNPPFKIFHAWFEILALLQLTTTDEKQIPKPSITCSIITVMTPIGRDRNTKKPMPYLHFENDIEGSSELLCLPFTPLSSMKTLQYFFENRSKEDSSAYMQLLDQVSSYFLEGMNFNQIKMGALKTLYIPPEGFRDFTKFLLKHPHNSFLRFGLILGYKIFGVDVFHNGLQILKQLQKQTRHWNSESKDTEKTSNQEESIKLTSEELSEILYKFYQLPQLKGSQKLDHALLYSILRTMGIYQPITPFGAYAEITQIPPVQEVSGSGDQIEWTTFFEGKEIREKLSSYQKMLDQRSYSRSKLVEFLGLLFRELRTCVENIPNVEANEELIHMASRVAFHLLQEWEKQLPPDPASITLTKEVIWLAQQLIQFDNAKIAAKLLYEAGRRQLFDPASYPVADLPSLDTEFQVIIEEELSDYPFHTNPSNPDITDWHSMLEETPSGLLAEDFHTPLGAKEFAEALGNCRTLPNQYQIQQAISILRLFKNEAIELTVQDDMIAIILYLFRELNSTSLATDENLRNDIQNEIQEWLKKIPLKKNLGMHLACPQSFRKTYFESIIKTLIDLNNQKRFPEIREILLEYDAALILLYDQQGAESPTAQFFNTFVKQQILSATKDLKNGGVCKKGLCLLDKYQNMHTALVLEIAKTFAPCKDKTVKHQLWELASSVIEKNIIPDNQFYLQIIECILEDKDSKGNEWKNPAHLQKIAKWLLHLEKKEDRMLESLCRELTRMIKESKKEQLQTCIPSLIEIRKGLSEGYALENNESLRLRIDFPLIRLLLKDDREDSLRYALILYRFHWMNSCTKKNGDQFFYLLKDVLQGFHKKICLEENKGDFIQIFANIDPYKFSIEDLITLSETIIFFENAPREFSQQGIHIFNKALQRIEKIQETQTKEMKAFFQRKKGWFNKMICHLLEFNHSITCREWIDNATVKKWLLCDSDLRGIEFQLFEKESQEFIRMPVKSRNTDAIQEKLKLTIDRLLDGFEKRPFNLPTFQTVFMTATALLMDHGKEEVFQKLLERISYQVKPRLLSIPDRKKEEVNDLTSCLHLIISESLKTLNNHAFNQLLYDSAIETLSFYLIVKQELPDTFKELFLLFIKVFISKRPQKSSKPLSQIELLILRKSISDNSLGIDGKYLIEGLIGCHIDLTLFCKNNSKSLANLCLSAFENTVQNLATSQDPSDLAKLKRICIRQSAFISASTPDTISKLFMTVNPILKDSTLLRSLLIKSFLYQSSLTHTVTNAAYEHELSFIEQIFRKENRHLLAFSETVAMLQNLFFRQLHTIRKLKNNVSVELQKADIYFIERHLKLFDGLVKTLEIDPQQEYISFTRIIINMFLEFYHHGTQLSPEQTKKAHDICCRWVHVNTELCSRMPHFACSLENLYDPYTKSEEHISKLFEKIF
jgi:hypothetical protein